MLTVGVVVGGFALVDTTASVEVTRLTRDIEAARAAIAARESDLSYLVRQEGGQDGLTASLDRRFRAEGFLVPDSGQVVVVELPEARWLPGEGKRHANGR
jgi:hypothetical protein